jgi:hypothetical protein
MIIDPASLIHACSDRPIPPAASGDSLVRVIHAQNHTITIGDDDTVKRSLDHGIKLIFQSFGVCQFDGD